MRSEQQVDRRNQQMDKHFSIFARKRKLHSPLDLSTEAITEFILEANPRSSAAQRKTIV